MKYVGELENDCRALEPVLDVIATTTSIPLGSKYSFACNSIETGSVMFWCVHLSPEVGKQ